jgi:hypothetical protein
MDQAKKEEEVLKSYLIDWQRSCFSPFNFDHKDGEKAMKYFKKKNIKENQLKTLYKKYHQ